MQKVQILRGTPEATFRLATPDSVAGRFALERILRQNMVVNGDMELDANWSNTTSAPATNERSQTKLHTGNYSRKFVPNAVNEGIQSDVFRISTVTGNPYHYTFAVYPDDGTVVSVIIRKGDDSGNLYDRTITGLTENAWNLVTIDVIEEAGGAGAYIIFHSGAQITGSFYIADVYGSRLGQPGQHSGRKATHAFITVEDQSIKWTVGGAEATASAGTDLGHVMGKPAAGSLGIIELYGWDTLRSFRYINETSASVGILQVTISF